MIKTIFFNIMFVITAVSITAFSFVVSIIISYFISIFICKLESNIYHDNFFNYLLFVRKICLPSDLITLIIWILIVILGLYIWNKKVDN